MITLKYTALADIFGRRPRPTLPPLVPAVGDILVRRPEYGPLEYAEVIGRYDEEAQIAHVRLWLYFGYQAKPPSWASRPSPRTCSGVSSPAWFSPKRTRRQRKRGRPPDGQAMRNQRQKKAMVRISMLSRGAAFGGLFGSANAECAVNRERPSVAESNTLNTIASSRAMRGK